jgi:hypothetical protein
LAKAVSEGGIVVGGRSKLPVVNLAKLRGEREHQRRPFCDGDGGLRRAWTVGVGFGGDGKSREDRSHLRWRRRRRTGPHCRGPRAGWSPGPLSCPSPSLRCPERRERRGPVGCLDSRSGWVELWCDGHCTAHNSHSQRHGPRIYNTFFVLVVLRACLFV